jgi:hypothetical protein
MSKMNTAYLKEHISCYHCQSNNIKRKHKQSFNTPIDENGKENIKKVYWRKFECNQCNNITNVLNDEDNILSSSKDVVLPFSAFDFVPTLEDSSMGFSLFYIDKINDNYVINDNVSERHILGFNNFFKENNVEVSNVMENTWEILFNKNKHQFKDIKEVYIEMTKLLTKAGVNFSWKEEIKEVEDTIDSFFLNDFFIYSEDPF